MASVPRRAFLRLAATAAVTGLFPRRAFGEETVLVGLVRPPDRRALADGAALGLEDANALATMFGRRLQLAAATAADARGAGVAARALAREGVIAVIGGAGPGQAEALRDVAAAEARLFFNAGAQDDALRGERCERHSYHLAPSVTMCVDALAQWLAGPRRLRRWAIVTDGSPRGREIEAAAQRAAGRLGAALSAGAAATDITLIAVDAASQREAAGRLRAAGVPFAGIGADAVADFGPEEGAGFWVVGWHHELERFSARELNRRFRRRFGVPLDETAWAARAAMKMIGEGAVRGGAGDAAGLRAFLGMAPPFDGHKGAALTFRPWDQQLRQPLYIIGPRRREEVGGARGPFEVLAQAPREDLDAIGIGRTETRCRELTR
ncbi:MAG TPA: ABC transporter substrate-binding protein [Methylomirabilota bacterium]|jgi:ABC-type branched-subunit amino acid transport system substrate-binding protein|nr:ABC transporter substrate-binding protein [Methylomirabilota bacterium]